jgi:signal peptidase II
MKRLRPVKVLMIVLIVLACVSCDQASKYAARSLLGSGQSVFLAGGHVMLRFVENEGAFLSLGAGLPRAARMVAFIAFPLLVLALMIFSIVRRGDIDWRMLIGFSLLLGGGLGNLIDRIFRNGSVRDFMAIGAGRLWSGIFNPADLCVMAGCLLLLLSPGVIGRSSSGSSPAARGE